MANTEFQVVAWLNSWLSDGWEAFGDKPDEAPEKYILVDRTGGPREAMVLDRAEILIEVYHKTSRADASEMANTIADRIVELEAYSDNVTHASVNSLVNLDDILGVFHRYQIFCDVYNRR